ncbi:hypothetical protein GCM10009665_68390 [Kitasatospora nipponensis]|uniref:Thioredoxin domain-containing protein n=1 Tax=Kitasatospora nipponensis TaxID=258049 RepID=A0ABN1WWZ7_9ACTN
MPQPPGAAAGAPARSGGSTSVGTASLVGYDASADAKAALAAAFQQAKADGRNVLLDFGASWCGNCKAVDGLYTNATVKPVLDAGFHVVKVDIGDQSATNFGILQTYDPKGPYTMPVLIVVAPDGSVRADTHRSGLPQLTAGGFSAFLAQNAK